MRKFRHLVWRWIAHLLHRWAGVAEVAAHRAASGATASDTELDASPFTDAAEGPPADWLARVGSAPMMTLASAAPGSGGGGDFSSRGEAPALRRPVLRSAASPRQGVAAPQKGIVRQRGAEAVASPRRAPAATVAPRRVSSARLPQPIGGRRAASCDGDAARRQTAESTSFPPPTRPIREREEDVKRAPMVRISTVSPAGEGLAAAPAHRPGDGAASQPHPASSPSEVRVAVEPPPKAAVGLLESDSSENRPSSFAGASRRRRRDSTFVAVDDSIVRGRPAARQPQRQGLALVGDLAEPTELAVERVSAALRRPVRRTTGAASAATAFDTVADDRVMTSDGLWPSLPNELSPDGEDDGVERADRQRQRLADLQRGREWNE